MAKVTLGQLLGKPDEDDPCNIDKTGYCWSHHDECSVSKRPNTAYQREKALNKLIADYEGVARASGLYDAAPEAPRLLFDLGASDKPRKRRAKKGNNPGSHR